MGLHDYKTTGYDPTVDKLRGTAAGSADAIAVAHFAATDGPRAGDVGAPRPGVEAAPAGDLAAALHEVSNALTVVTGWLDRAREGVAEGAGAEAVERAIAIAASRARHARVVVRRAIGADVAREPPRSVGEVVADAAVGLEPEARDEGVRIAVDVDDDVARVELADASSVLQVLTNLLLNAIAVSPPGAVVRLDARRGVEGAVALRVADEGPGVPPGRRATLLTAGVSTRAGGAGIGLRHAAGLARAAGGSLQIVDVPRGATFELVWPAGHAPISAVAPSAPRVSLEGARILLVEDDDAVVDLLDTALGGRGASVVAIRAERDLAAALASGPFDAALLDASPFAGELGLALETVRRASPGARLVVISGSACAPPALPAGLDAAWVRKPFEVSEIVASLTAPRGV
jgi:CheY-like chemotaxis protein